jgi:RNA polymerase sigma-70 factor (ECF subfamily)
MNVRALVSDSRGVGVPVRKSAAGAVNVEDSGSPAFEHEFTMLFDAHFERIFRYLDRLSGDADVAADAAQEAFVRLFWRGSLPDDPAAWLITVALNQFRNSVSQRARRRKLLTPMRGRSAHSDPPPAPGEMAEVADERRRARHAVDLMPKRDRELLLLRAEGYSYRELAGALRLNEASIGTLLARARDAFRALYEESTDAS